MSMSSPQYSTPQPPPPTQAYSPYPPPPVQAQAVVKTNWLYALPLVGTLVLAAGTVLPWISFAFASSFLAMESSINGYGGCNGSPILCTAITKNLHYNNVDALIVLGMVAVALVVGAFGLFRGNKGQEAPVWALGAVAGLIGGGIALYDLIYYSNKLGEVSQDANSAGGGAVIAAAQTGVGLYVAVLGALIVVAGFALAGNRRKLP